MPTYDYDCDKCGVFEVFQMMSAEKFTECPQCGSKKIKRLIGAGMGIIFKGTGFYETDYKRKENKSKTKDIANTNKSEAKTESKPEAKSKGETDSKPKPAESKKQNDKK
ncbi:MAG: zinc ribbon domain-containing protein [PVC group bacterium]|nr:zinc ribbon domain-containing protein [PVC group bacterium]